MIALYAGFAKIAALAQPAALLGARLLVARVFLLSGLTKWNGLSVSEDAYYLFAEEFFAAYNLPAAVTNTLAVITAVAEIVLPLLLILGLFARVGALGLLIMTAVIQLLVYPDAWWNVHAWWAAVLLVVLSLGPGAWSLDRLFKLER